MMIAGCWLRGSDGFTRPLVFGRVIGAGGQLFDETFLIDSGSDRTVFTAGLLERLNLPSDPPPPELSLKGIGGESLFVLLKTVLEFERHEGGTTRVRGEYAAFTDPSTIDLSILGRDVLHHFDVILSRRRAEVLLLAPNHRYDVSGH